MIKVIEGYIGLEEGLFLIIGSIILGGLGLKLGKKVGSFVEKWMMSILIIIGIIEIVL